MGAILNTVYNNYLSTYTPKSVTRYDAHKKSELRSVYSSIVKLTKDSPWYLPTTSKETQQYAVDVKENARGLHNTIAQLGGLEEDGLLTKKSAFSSNEDIVSATYIGTENPDEPVPELSIEVKALASSQENMGTFLPDEPVSLPPDTYSFDVGINDMNYEFQFSISAGETNRDVQERLARLISNSGIGLKASVLEAQGRTALSLVSEGSGLPAGKSEIFNISDDRTSKRSGTAQYFGLDYTAREASNAVFLLNGEERTASSNHFTIGKQFEVELKGVSAEDDPVKVGLKEDMDSLADNISQLLGGYNGFLKAASAYLDTQSRSRKLIQEFDRIAEQYQSSLEAMGVRYEEDGTLSLDRDLFRQTAAQSEDLAETFGSLKEFSSSLLRKSNQVSLNPMNYVEKTVVAYKNPGHTYVSPYTTSAYSGMMFNGYC